MPESIRRVPMTQEKTQPNELAGAFPAFNKGSVAPDSSSISSASSASLASSPSPSSPDLHAESTSESAINKELRRLNRALRALSACSQALAQSGQRAGVAPADMRHHCAGGRIPDVAFIAYAEQDEDKTVRPMAHAGHGDGDLEGIALKWSDTPGGRGPAGAAIRENRICAITDTANDVSFEPWRDAALQRGYEAVIALPLRVAGSPFGVLTLYSGQAGSFESSEEEMLTEMANNLSYGITAMRSHEDAKRATAALQEAESKYRQLVEQVPAISYVAEAGAQGRFLYLSPQVNTILGYTPRGLSVESVVLVGSTSTLRITRPRCWKIVGKKGIRFRWNTACGGRTGARCGCAMRQ